MATKTRRRTKSRSRRKTTGRSKRRVSSRSRAGSYSRRGRGRSTRKATRTRSKARRSTKSRARTSRRGRGRRAYKTYGKGVSKRYGRPWAKRLKVKVRGSRYQRTAYPDFYGEASTATNPRRGRKGRGRRRNPGMVKHLRDGGIVTIDGSSVTLLTPQGERKEIEGVSNAMSRLKKVSSTAAAYKVLAKHGSVMAVNPRRGRKSRGRARTRRNCGY